MSFLCCGLMNISVFLFSWLSHFSVILLSLSFLLLLIMFFSYYLPVLKGLISDRLSDKSGGETEESRLGGKRGPRELSFIFICLLKTLHRKLLQMCHRQIYRRTSKHTHKPLLPSLLLAEIRIAPVNRDGKHKVLWEHSKVSLPFLSHVWHLSG